MNGKKETTTQRKRRLEKARRKRLEKIANESDEARRQRLEKERVASAKRRENETAEQRAARLERERIRTREIRKQRSVRLERERNDTLETRKQLSDKLERKKLQETTDCKKQWTIYLRDSFRSALKRKETKSSLADYLAASKLKKLHPPMKDTSLSNPDQSDESDDSYDNPWESSPGHQSEENASAVSNNSWEPHKDEDDIDIFFRGLAATVKKLSPYNQEVAKSKAFSAISELQTEEKTQIGRLPSPGTSRSPVSSSESHLPPCLPNELGTVCVKSEPEVKTEDAEE